MKTLRRDKAKAARNTAAWLPRSKRGRFFTRLISLIMVMSLILGYPGGALADSPSIAEFTAYPPFGGKLIKPNVLLNLDNSVSLNYFAYDFNYNAVTEIGTTTITASVIGNGGSIDLIGDVLVSLSTDQSFTVTADPGYQILDVWVDNTPVGIAAGLLTYTFTFNNVGGSHTISASFASPAGAGSGAGSSDDAYTNTAIPPVSTGFNPAKEYYGYFNSYRWYKYPNSSTPEFKSVGAMKNTIDASKTDTSWWDGNFLNWLTMRRVDIIKKVLIGGKTRARVGITPGHPYDLIGQPGRNTDGGYQKQVATAENYIDSGLGAGIVTFTFNNDDSKGNNRNVDIVAAFSIGTNYNSGNDFNVRTHLGSDPEGVIQRVGDSVRWGLELMDDGTGIRMEGMPCEWSETGSGKGGMGIPDVQGGSVVVPVGYNKVNGLVSWIAKTGPFTPSTPLAESIWTATGYFMQYSSTNSSTGPRYTASTSDYPYGSYPVGNAYDPYNYAVNPSSTNKKWVPCANSFVITITDGEPTKDRGIPAAQKNYGPTYADSAANEKSGKPGVPSWADEANNYFWDSVLDGSHYVDNIALYGHADINSIPKKYRDLRPSPLDGTKSIPGDDAAKWQQNLTYYFIYASFGGGTPDARRLLNWSSGAGAPPDDYTNGGGGAARNGSFIESGTNYKPDAAGEYNSDGDEFDDTFFEAKTGDELEAALIKALYDIIYNRTKSGAASAIVGTRGGDGTIYQAYFYPGIINAADGERRWLGYLRALSVDTDGNINSTPLWEAGKKLWERNLSTSPRTIYTTTNGSTRITFDPGASAAVTALKPYLRAGSNNEAEAIMRYITGEDDSPTVGMPSTTYNYRPRTVTISGTTNIWKLGDIVYSSPTPVGAPAERYDKHYADATYAAFYSQYKDRSTVVYAGANDGMLHAFNGSATGGDELWAFIPKQLLPHLKWLTDPNYTHVYYVDLKPKVTDAQIFSCNDGIHYGENPDTNKCWGTILIGGMRLGGKNITWTSGGNTYQESPAYFALDITNPSNPTLLWTFTNSNLGFTTSYPAIARVKDGATDRWVMIVGSGPDTFDDALSNVSSAQTGKVFVVDLGNGGLLKTLDLGTLNLNTNYTFMADPITVDVNLDYKVDVAYIGDANGNLYRLVTKNSADVVNDWTLSTLISTTGAKQITSAPSAALDGNRNLWVYFGTGKFIGSEDKQTIDAQAFYGVKDECKPWTPDSIGNYPLCSGPSYTVSDNATDLYNASATEVIAGDEAAWTSITSDAGAKKGWKINFPSVSGHTSLTGERSLAKPLVVGGLVMFTTYIPEDELCSDNEGAGYLWAVYYKTGTAYKEHVFTDPTTTVTREQYLGEGFATVTATVTKGGGLKTFASTLLGKNFEIDVGRPFKLTSGLSGWSPQCPE